MAANNALRSRRQPVVRNPLAPVVESVFATPQGKLYPVFNGTTHYATIPAWTPVSAQWGVSAEVNRAADLSTNQRYLGNSADSLAFYLDATGNPDSAGVKYQSGAVNTFFVATAVPVPVGRTVISNDFYPDKIITTTPAGSEVGATANKPDFPQPSIDRIGGQSILWGGGISNVRLYDRTPLQGARFLPGNGSTRHWKLAVPQLPTGSTVRFWYKHTVTGVEQTIIGSTEASKLFYVHATDVFLFTPDVTVKVDGVAITNGTFAATGGQHYQIELTIVNARTITTVGTDNTGAGGISGTVGDFHALNASNGNSYDLLGRNDSGNVVLNSSKTVLGAEEWKNPTLESQWEDLGGGSYRLNGDAGGSLSSLYVTGLEVGALYRLDLSATISAGELKLYGITAPFTKFSSIVNGSQTIFFRPDVSSVGFARNAAGVQTVADVLNISLRRVHSIGTAEGAEVSLPAVSTFGTDANNTVVITSNNEFTFFGDGTSFFGASYTSALVVGQGYIVRGRAVVRQGAVKVQYEGVDSSFGQIAESGPFEFFAIAGSTVLQFCRRTGGQPVDVDIVVDELRLATHGTAYEGSTPMTNAAADSARSFLPMISREYIFDEAGRIQEVRGGGADATLQGGLSATDWKPE